LEASALVAVGLAAARAIIARIGNAVVDGLLAADAREAELAAAGVADGTGEAGAAIEAGIARAEVVAQLARLAVVGLGAYAAVLAVAQVLARRAILAGRGLAGHHADLAGGAGEAGQALAREVVEGG